MGIAVRILLLGLPVCHCALEVEICLQSKPFTPQLPAKIIKTVAGTRVLQHANFHTVCSQNNAYVESSYFAQNVSIFTCIHRGLKRFSGRENPRTTEMGEGEGEGLKDPTSKRKEGEGKRG